MDHTEYVQRMLGGINIDDHSGVTGYSEGLSSYNTTLKIAIRIIEHEMNGRVIKAIPETEEEID